MGEIIDMECLVYCMINGNVVDKAIGSGEGQTFLVNTNKQLEML